MFKWLLLAYLFSGRDTRKGIRKGAEQVALLYGAIALVAIIWVLCWAAGME